MFQLNFVNKMVILIGFLLFSAPLLAKTTPVIRVRNTTITQEKIDSISFILAKSQFPNQTLSTDEMQIFKKAIAGNLLGKELLLLEINSQKLKVNKRILDSTFSVFKGQLESIGSYKQVLSRAGGSEKKIKDEIHQQLLIEKLIKKELKKVDRPSDEEMKKFFKENQSQFPVSNQLRASQIVLKLKKGASSTQIANKKKKLNKIKANLNKLEFLDQKVEYFMQTAVKMSDGPEAAKGGDLEAFSKGDFFPAFDKAISKLKVGQVSEPFRSPIGVHLVMLTDKNDGTYENSKIKIFQYLVGKRTVEQQDGLVKYLKKLVKKYNVAYLDPSYKGIVSAEMDKKGMK